MSPYKARYLQLLCDRTVDAVLYNGACRKNTTLAQTSIQNFKQETI